MPFEFHLPLTLGELLQSGGIDQYVVQEVLPVRLLGTQLGVYKAAFRGAGPAAILEHFDTLYSILHHFRSLKLDLKEETLELLIKAVSRHAKELPTILEDITLSSADRGAHFNTLKMNCYLLIQLVEAFEAETYKTGLVNLEAGSKGKKGKVKAGGFDWESEREEALQAMLQLVQLDVRRLWSMSVVEEEFVSLVTGTCYKILENPSIAQAKNKPTRDVVAHTLGVMVKRYNHMLSASLKIIQLLQHFDHLAPVFVQAVSLWATDFGMKTIVGEIMREIGQKSEQELARETSGVKAYSTFLMELVEQIPAVMLPSMSVLMDHLYNENYLMRIALLTLMGVMVIRVLSGDQMDEVAKGNRDDFLDSLQDHMHDVNAFVRSKALQILSRVVQEKALPISRYNDVVSRTVGRLSDKSVNVSKNAIQLLATFLANNPFTCKLSSANLIVPLEKETLKLKEMIEKLRAAAPVVITPEEEWEAMLPEVCASMQSLLQGQPMEEEEETEGIGAEETAEQVAERITKLLKKNSYKHAIALVRAAVINFPGSDLFPETEDQEEQILEILEKLFTGKRGASEAAPDESEQLSAEPEIAEQAAAPAAAPSGELPSDVPGARSELVKQEMLVQYLADTHNFAVRIEEAIDVISKMMYQTTVTVVQEVIDFFVTVSQFGVPRALLGVSRMLPLVWSKDPGVKEAVLGAYRRLYLSPAGESERAKAQTLVDSLSILTLDASLSTIQCLEEIVSEFVQKDEIRPAVIQQLWERFTEKASCSPPQRRAAVMLLGMMARGRPDIVGSNMDTLVTVGLGERVHEDYQIAREVCNTILKIGDRQKKQTHGKSVAPFRLPREHLLFNRLTDAVVGGIVKPSLLWLPFTETAITLIYQLAEDPETIAAKILHRCATVVVEELKCQTAETPEGADQLQKTPSADGASDSLRLPTFLLAHLLSLAGNVAFQEVVHLERSVSAELRRRRVIKEDRDAKKSAEKQKKQKGHESTMGDESAMEEELGLVGASADDTEAELIRKICESELLDNAQYLSRFIPPILMVCNCPGKYSDPDLQTVASLALAKFMMISSDFCDANLRLLFTLLEKSPLSSVRSNLLIALGDLSIRFPNLIEPWTPSLYARLRDESSSVRKTAGMVMTHLILKDMVKVKGQVSEMAVLLIDPEPEIAMLARNFFNELSNKGNAVYNLLPDIISRLSDPECGVEEEPFQTILKQLLSYITKDKQTESLVEKLCQRFRTARTERQWRDLAYCLTLLPYSERGLRKMQENFDCFGDKLTEDTVYNCFVTVIGKLQRGAKPEVKVLIDEFEQKVRACHSRGLENMEGPVDVPEGVVPPQTNAKNVKKNPAGKKRPGTRNESTKGVSPDFITPKTRAGRRAQPTRKKLAVAFSSEEESSEESDEDMEAEMSETETPKNTTPIRRTSKRTTKAK